jgi:hypothetical protein
MNFPNTRCSKNTPSSVVELDLTEVLTEITVDDYHFMVTMHTAIGGNCVLWMRDHRTRKPFEALGRFSTFDKRGVLFFIARFTTNPDLRTEINNRRFERKLESLSMQFLDDIERNSKADRTAAFKNLFDLDDEIDHSALAKRRRLMARKFHPDAGGDHRAMSIINEAYEFLTANAPR